MSWFDLIGLTGVAIILATYVLLQLDRVDPARQRYSAANALGAALVLFSLAFDFNLSAAIVEAAWLVISLYGLWRARKRKRDLPRARN